ncbi:hypothetical protein KAS45_00425 [candidate division WOR-3 bacterium]|nr:hypothetical protein [candidate division WOR-3 bacterium]
MIARTEFQDIIKLDGEVRGSTLKTDAAFVESQEGKEGLHRVEAAFQQLGYPMQYKQVKEMGWYPICLRVLSLSIIKDIFNLKDVDLRNMGDMAPKFSFTVKVFMQFPGIPSVGLKNVPRYWRMHYSIGEMRASEVNDKDGYFYVQLTDFKVHPILCRYFEGYFRRLSQFSFVEEEVQSIETKCVFDGDPYHEYRITWK